MMCLQNNEPNSRSEVVIDYTYDRADLGAIPIGAIDYLRLQICR